MTTTTDPTARLLQLEGAFNVRDIGGYETAGGSAVQRGRLFRADGLHKLTESDQTSLLGRGVRTIIDLRHGDELQQNRNVFADSGEVSYHNVSLINPATTMAANIRSLGDMYKNMLDECGPQLRQVFELISGAEGEGVLFHCAAGKDRTGVVAALLLDLAGVPVQTIAADYAETETNLLPLMEKFRAEMPESMQGMNYDAFLGSAPENMELMLDHLHRVYGGAESYLQSIGINGTQITALKQRLLEV